MYKMNESENVSHVYILPSSDKTYLKIGKANDFSRIETLLKTYDFDLNDSLFIEVNDVDNVFSIEKEFHNAFKEHKYHPKNKYEGYTELFDYDVIYSIEDVFNGIKESHETIKLFKGIKRPEKTKRVNTAKKYIKQIKNVYDDNEYDEYVNMLKTLRFDGVYLSGDFDNIINIRYDISEDDDSEALIKKFTSIPILWNSDGYGGRSIGPIYTTSKSDVTIAIRLNVLLEIEDDRLNALKEYVTYYMDNYIGWTNFFAGMFDSTEESSNQFSEMMDEIDMAEIVGH